MRWLGALLLLVLLCGCDLSMKRQESGKPQRSPTLWAGGPAVTPPPEGTRALDQAARDAALETPPPLTPALLARGQERYGIYCVMCHGALGQGDGIVVRRGFPPPPSFRAPRLVTAAPAYVVQVITRGHGIMYGYGDRVEPADRWAIAAYVKTLQRVRP